MKQQPDNTLSEPDPHFGSHAVMTAWAKEEKLDIVYNEDGTPDWHAVYRQYKKREKENLESPEYMAALAEKENLKIVYKEDGTPDWKGVYLQYLQKNYER